MGSELAYVARLGEGGLAQVWAARMRDQVVAVKRVRDRLARDPGVLALFVAEARLAMRLDHPNVVRALAIGDDAGQPFFAMELVDGPTYAAARERPLASHVAILARVLDALAHLHDLGVVHRDVSPANVLLAPGDRPKLIDFGIASPGPAPRSAGTLGYMAPEQARGEEVDGRADLFAVGVMLWEAIHSRLLWFRGAPRLDVLEHVAHGNVLDVARFRADAPPTLAAIGRRALAARREDRFPDARAMAAALDAWLAVDDRAAA